MTRANTFAMIHSKSSTTNVSSGVVSKTDGEMETDDSQAVTPQISDVAAGVAPLSTAEGNAGCDATNV